MKQSMEAVAQSNTDKVILVDESDRPVGEMEKMRAHREGRLHRAFSVFIYNDRGEMLLQRRAATKYHSAGLWSNACCSHPRPGETIEQAAHRRLHEEMGFDCDLEPAFRFIYRAELDGDMTEHELDHVLRGRFSGTPTLNRREADGYSYRPVGEIEEELASSPENFSAWFRLCFPRIASTDK